MALDDCSAQGRVRAARRARRVDRCGLSGKIERPHLCVFVVSDWCSLGLCDTACLCTVFTIPITEVVKIQSQEILVDDRMDVHGEQPGPAPGGGAGISQWPIFKSQ